MNSRRAWLAATIVLALVLVAVVSSGLTIVLYDTYRAGSAAPDDPAQTSDAKAQDLQKYKRLDEILDIVKDYYYKDVSEEDLITGAERGMLYALDDPYTFYYTPQEWQEMNDRTEGKYAGIGLQLIVDPDDKLITVTRAFKDSPGAKAGIHTGDKIVNVLGTEVTGYEMDKAVSMMKGEAGTEAKIIIQRGSERIPITVQRAIIKINRVEYRMLENDIGYLELYEFMGDDVEGFKEAISYFTQHNAKGLIIDLRNNPGGLVTDVVQIADILCPKGRIVYTEDRYGNQIEETSDASMLGLPLVVLVNGMSASASEILAGAVQDYGIGTIVGTQTFGKGIVQTLHRFNSDKAGMQLTTSRYFTPNGRSIHEVGITPDVYVNEPEGVTAAQIALNPALDVQFQRAVETMRAKLANQPLPSSEPKPTDTPAP